MSAYMQNNNITGLNISYGDIEAEHLKLLQRYLLLTQLLIAIEYQHLLSY